MIPYVPVVLNARRLQNHPWSPAHGAWPMEAHGAVADLWR